MCCSLSQHSDEQLQLSDTTLVSESLCDSFTQALDSQASRLAMCRLTQLIYFDEDPRLDGWEWEEEAKSSQSRSETILFRLYLSN